MSVSRKFVHVIRRPAARLKLVQASLKYYRVRLDHNAHCGVRIHMQVKTPPGYVIRATVNNLTARER